MRKLIFILAMMLALPAVAQSGPADSYGALSLTNLNDKACMRLGHGESTAVVSFVGLTAAAATVTFKVGGDVPFVLAQLVAVNGVNQSTKAAATTATVDGLYNVDVAGKSYFCAVMTTAGSSTVTGQVTTSLGVSSDVSSAAPVSVNINPGQTVGLTSPITGTPASLAALNAVAFVIGSGSGGSVAFTSAASPLMTVSCLSSLDQGTTFAGPVCGFTPTGIATAGVIPVATIVNPANSTWTINVPIGATAIEVKATAYTSGSITATPRLVPFEPTHSVDTSGRTFINGQVQVGIAVGNENPVVIGASASSATGTAIPAGSAFIQQSITSGGVYTTLLSGNSTTPINAGAVNSAAIGTGLVVMDGYYNPTPGAGTAGNMAANQFSSITGGLFTEDATKYLKTTYSGATGSFASAAAATDVCYVGGSASKTVRITKLAVSGTQTTAGELTVQLIKRSTANTAGTCVTVTSGTYDSNNAAVTGTLASCTANPTVGTPVYTVDSKIIPVGGVTGSVTPFIWNFGPPAPTQSITLRGVAQQLAVSLNGATVTGGSFNCAAEWTEE